MEGKVTFPCHYYYTDEYEHIYEVMIILSFIFWSQKYSRDTSSYCSSVRLKC